jgi:hypothetical protein
MTVRSIETGLARAGWLVASGLALQIGLSWLTHPLAFIAFLLLACPLVMAGTLIFFWTLLRADSSSV